MAIFPMLVQLIAGLVAGLVLHRIGRTGDMDRPGAIIMGLLGGFGGGAFLVHLAGAAGMGGVALALLGGVAGGGVLAWLVAALGGRLVSKAPAGHPLFG